MSDSSFVYLDDILDRNEKVYVRPTHRKKAILVLKFVDGNQIVPEVIPRTKYPICLSNKATPMMLRSSRDLRLHLERGTLTLVSQTVAEAELSKPGVRDALRQAYDNINPSTSTLAKARYNEPDPIDPILGEDPTRGNFIHLDRTGDLEDADSAGGSDDFELDDDSPDLGVSPRVESLVAALLGKDKKARQVKAELMSEDLTEEDLSFLIENTSGIVQAYAKEQYHELTGRESEEDSFEDGF